MSNNYNCIIIDDEPKILELLSEYISELYPEIFIEEKCNDWKSAYNALKQNSYDIIFLDISMPEKTGFDLLELLPDVGSEVIFVTAHTEFALDAFNFDVCGYILKPVTEKSLVKSISRAIKRIESKSTAIHADSSKVGIPDNDGIQFINVNDIIYCKTSNRYTKVVTKSTEILSSYSLGKFKEVLVQDFFFQPHRSYVINVHHINRYDSSGMISMIDGTNVPISRKLKDDFLKMFSRIRK